MPTILEQISATAKDNYAARVALFTGLTQSVWDGMSKLIALNLDAAKAPLTASTETAHQLIAAKGPQEFLALTTASAQPTVDNALAYARQVASITLATQAEVSQATEAAIAEIRRNRMALMDEIAKNAPAGSEHTFSLFKSVIDNAATGYDAWTRQTQQAAGMLDGQLTTAANQTVQAVKKTSAAAKASAAA